MFSYNRECASERVAPETERVCSLYFRIRSLVFTRDAVCGYTLLHTQADNRMCSLVDRERVCVVGESVPASVSLLKPRKGVFSLL